jgi:hypothetical protein
MKEYITSGVIATTPISPREIQSGTIALINRSGTYYRVTVTHVNQQGYWVVEGDYDGIISDMSSLFKFSVLHTEGVHTIAVKDWKTILANEMHLNLASKEEQNFKIKPLKFKEGTAVKECSNCNGIFDGGGSQEHCKRCCDELGTAYLSAASIVLNPNKKSIPIFTTDLEEIAREAYERGREGKDTLSFEKWLVKSLKKWQ